MKTAAGLALAFTGDIRRNVDIIEAYIGAVAEIRYSARLSFMTVAESDAVSAFPGEPLQFAEDASIFEIYGRCATLEDSLWYITRVVNNDACLHRITFERSSTFSESAFSKRESARAALAAIYRAFDEMDTAVFAVRIPIEEIVAEIPASPCRGRFFVYCMQRVFREVPGDLPRAVSEAFEAAKDAALGSEIVAISDAIVKQYVCRGDLLPTTACMSAGNIENYIRIHAGGLEVSIANGAVSDGAGMILIVSPAGETHEYNIGGLGDHKYIMKNNMDLPYFCGINNRVIARYRVISRPDAAIDHSGTRISIHGPIDSAKWIVIESPNAGTYRLLGAGSRNVLDLADVRPLIAARFPARSMTYNDLHADAILRNFYARDANRVLRDYEHGKLVAQASNFSRELVSAIFAKWSKLTGAHAKLSRKHVDGIMTDNKWVAEIVVDQMMHILPESPGDDFVADEIALGRLSKAIPIADAFRRGLSKRWAEHSANMHDMREVDAFFADTLGDAVAEMFDSTMMAKFEMGVKEYFLGEFKRIAESTK